MANSRGALTVDACERSYEIHVLALDKADQPPPVVLVLHGRLGDGHRTSGLTHFDKVSEAHGFPRCLTRRPAPRLGRWTWRHRLRQQGVSDVKFLRGLIGKLSSEHRIDASCVYVTGISNGGFMSPRVACELSDQVAAGRVVAATVGEATADACRLTRAVSVRMLPGLERSMGAHAGRTHRAQRNGSHGTILSLEATRPKWVLGRLQFHAGIVRSAGSSRRQHHHAPSVVLGMQGRPRSDRLHHRRAAIPGPAESNTCRKFSSAKPPATWTPPKRSGNSSPAIPAEDALTLVHHDRPLLHHPLHVVERHIDVPQRIALHRHQIGEVSRRHRP
jgi:Esterase PHB depolymerase